MRTLIFGNEVPGYPSLMAVVLFLGAAQLVTLGVIGEYLGRVFEEVKQRPLYLISQYLPSEYVPGEYLPNEPDTGQSDAARLEFVARN